MDTIQSYMSKNLSIISSEATAQEAARKMLEDSVYSLIVVHNGRHTGIITDVDMTRKVVALGLNPKEVCASSIMETPLITLDASLPMSEALLCMKKNIIRHVLATNEDKVVGIISINDLAHYHSPDVVDPIGEFWGDSEVLLDEEMFYYAIDKLLNGMGQKLGSSSKTGKAIKNKEPLLVTIQYAKEEGLNSFAHILKLATE